MALELFNFDTMTAREAASCFTLDNVLLPTDSSVLYHCRYGISACCAYVYSAVKPACALVALFLSLFGLYEDGNFDPTQSWIWLTLIINVSVAVAFYCLVSS